MVWPCPATPPHWPRADSDTPPPPPPVSAGRGAATDTISFGFSPLLYTRFDSFLPLSRMPQVFYGPTQTPANGEEEWR